MMGGEREQGFEKKRFGFVERHAIEDLNAGEEEEKERSSASWTENCLLGIMYSRLL